MEERIYVIPLREEWSKVADWKRSKKAIKAIREFVRRHAKVERVKISEELDRWIWKRGAKHPPHKVRVKVKKEEKTAVVELVR